MHVHKYERISMWIIVLGLLLTTAYLIGWVSNRHKPSEINESCSEIKEAYTAVIHRIWLDQPLYVEDVLLESSEMLYLGELLDNDWGKTFTFWCKQDSIDYNTNWVYDPLITVSEPDIPAIKLNPEKISKLVEPISITNGD